MFAHPFHYKYVVISYGYEYYDYVYRDYQNCSYAKYFNEIRFPHFLESLYHRHISLPLNTVLFRDRWTKVYVHYIDKQIKTFVKDGEIVCFLLLAGGKNNQLLRYGLTEHLRRKYSRCKIVYFINDLVAKTNQPIELIKSKADLVISFDPGDAMKYNVLYHVIPYSKNTFCKSTVEYDIAFVGAAKDRLHTLLDIHKYLISNGVNSHFHIINAPEKDQEQLPGVVYSGFITYEENLSVLSKSRCIIEIVQKGSCGNTIRVGEAIMLRKKILTNNPRIAINGVYDSTNMRIFSNCKDIDIDFIKEKIEVKYSIADLMYPDNLLLFIEKNIIDE